MSFREYEIKHKPLFASMKRAKTALLKAKNEPLTIPDFFSYLEERYGELSEHIEYVTFYDYTNLIDNVKYHIAYIYTAPSLMLRDLLFDEREDITKDTGWYPMVSGSRANFTTIKIEESYRFWKIVKHKPPYVHLGKPLSLRNVATDISSTAILFKCENGNILFDTGFGVDEDVIDSINFVFLSHFHRDHSGGVFELLRIRNIPIILSSITLEYLLNLKGIEPIERQRLLNNAVLIESIKDRSYIKNTISFFDSYHCPGSYGLKYMHYDDVVVYPGDMCLANGFFNFHEEIKRVICNSSRKRVALITDCALVPRGDFAITDESFEIVANRVFEAEQHSVFISRSPESLFNIYIRMFKLSIDKHSNWLFVVNEELYYILRSSLRTWLLPEYEGDLFIKHIIKGSRVNFAETQRLYTISNVEQFSGNKEKRIVFLLTMNDLEKLSNSLVRKK